MNKPSVLMITSENSLNGRKLQVKHTYELLSDNGDIRTIDTIEQITIGKKTKYYSDHKKMDRTTGKYCPFAIQRKELPQDVAVATITSWDTLRYTQSFKSSKGGISVETRYINQ